MTRRRTASVCRVVCLVLIACAEGALIVGRLQLGLALAAVSLASLIAAPIVEEPDWREARRRGLAARADREALLAHRARMQALARAARS